MKFGSSFTLGRQRRGLIVDIVRSGCNNIACWGGGRILRDFESINSSDLGWVQIAGSFGNDSLFSPL